MTTVLITGANRGIGLSFAKLYSQQDAIVYAVCRRSSLELDALPVTVISGIDVTDPVAVAQLKESIGDSKIDILVNNAGILQNEVLGQIDYDSIRQQLEVNALGPLQLTEALIPNMANPGKIAFITSRMGSIADNTSGGRYGYRMSKAALNIAAVSLCHDLESQGIAVAILHPGLVATDMIGGHGDITPDVAAERLMARIRGLTLENTGTFWHSSGEVLPW